MSREPAIDQVRTNGRRSRALNEDDIAIVARALRDGNL
jgi:hypothetical protein